jgi:hypothetical protein
MAAWNKNVAIQLKNTWTIKDMEKKMATELAKKRAIERMERERIQKEQELMKEIELKDAKVLSLIALIKASHNISLEASKKQDIMNFIMEQQGYPIIKDLMKIFSEYCEPELSKNHELDIVTKINHTYYGISHHYTKCGYYYCNNKHCGHEVGERDRCNNLICQMVHGIPYTVDGKVCQRSFYILYRYKTEQKRGIAYGFVDTNTFSIDYAKRNICTFDKESNKIIALKYDGVMEFDL